MAARSRDVRASRLTPATLSLSDFLIDSAFIYMYIQHLSLSSPLCIPCCSLFLAKRARAVRCSCTPPRRLFSRSLGHVENKGARVFHLRFFSLSLYNVALRSARIKGSRPFLPLDLGQFYLSLSAAFSTLYIICIREYSVYSTPERR